MKNSASRISRLGLLLLFAPCVQAHENLPTNWCMDPNAAPVVTAQFSFTPEMLESYRRANPDMRIPTNDCDPTADRSCGIVDEWHYANEMSMAFCGGGENSVNRSGTDKSSTLPDKPKPFVWSPTDFNIREHHEAYRFHDGNLVGTCIVCMSPPEAPAPLPQEPDKE